MSPVEFTVDPGLLARCRKAVEQVRWRSVSPGRPRRRHEVHTIRVAHLHDEEARVETRETERGFELTVDAGPVGALLVLVEASERGAPQQLTQREGDPSFRAGLLRAVWGTSGWSSGTPVPFADIVALARYALV